MFNKDKGDIRLIVLIKELMSGNFISVAPVTSRPLNEIYDDFKKNILPYYIGNIHPRFWGWVMGTGSAQSMLTEMLAAGMNCNVGIGDQSPGFAYSTCGGDDRPVRGTPAKY